MKVIVTGATGFVGGALVRALVARGDEVTAVARPSADRTVLADVPVRWVTGDVTQPDSLAGQFAGADALIHAAGMLGQAGVHEAAYTQLNVEGTRYVLAEAARVGIGRVVHVGSPGVLGPIVGPPATEEAPLAPSNVYERSKAEAERIVLKAAEAGLPVVIVRPEFVYGVGDLHVLGLFRTVQRGLFFYVNGGRALCHPTYIGDAVAGTLLALDSGRVGQIYHLCGPQPVTFRELGEALADGLGVRRPWLSVPRPLAWGGAAVLEGVGKVLGVRPPIGRAGIEFFSDSRHFSFAKAHRELGYTPETTLAQGVAQTIAWYREKGLLVTR